MPLAGGKVEAAHTAVVAPEVESALNNQDPHNIFIAVFPDGASIPNPKPGSPVTPPYHENFAVSLQLRGAGRGGFRIPEQGLGLRIEPHHAPVFAGDIDRFRREMDCAASASAATGGYVPGSFDSGGGGLDALLRSTGLAWLYHRGAPNYPIDPNSAHVIAVAMKPRDLPGMVRHAPLFVACHGLGRHQKAIDRDGEQCACTEMHASDLAPMQTLFPLTCSAAFAHMDPPVLDGKRKERSVVARRENLFLLRKIRHTEVCDAPESPVPLLVKRLGRQRHTGSRVL